MSRGRYPTRIKLKGLDLSSLERHLQVWDPADLYFHPDSFPLLDSPSFFGRAAGLTLDLGCGTGEFLCGLARRRPDELFLGLDSAYKPLVRAAVRAAGLGLNNACFIRADFRQAARRMAPGSFRAVYLQFPLPGSPAQGYRPRIFNSGFLREIFRVLEPGGRLGVLTDREAACREMLRVLERTGGFRQVLESDFEFEIDGELRSHNYSVWAERGGVPFRFEAEKLGDIPISPGESFGGIYEGTGS